jgi:hypothetical protein
MNEFKDITSMNDLSAVMTGPPSKISDIPLPLITSVEAGDSHTSASVKRDTNDLRPPWGRVKTDWQKQSIPLTNLALLQFEEEVTGESDDAHATYVIPVACLQGTEARIPPAARASQEKWRWLVPAAATVVVALLAGIASFTFLRMLDQQEALAATSGEAPIELEAASDIHVARAFAAAPARNPNVIHDREQFEAAPQTEPSAANRRRAETPEPKRATAHRKKGGPRTKRVKLMDIAAAETGAPGLSGTDATQSAAAEKKTYEYTPVAPAPKTVRTIVPAPAKAPSTASVTPSNEAPAGSLASILLSAKTNRPRAKTYKHEINQILDAPPEQIGQPSKSLTPKMVRQTMAAIAPAVKRCGFGKQGQVAVRVAVAGATGRVIETTTQTPSYKGTPTSHCVSRALHLAKFPKFQSKRQDVTHTFQVQ